MTFRRKVLPPALVPAHDVFLAVLEELEPAKAGLSDVLPGTRLPGRPLHDALEEFVMRLERAGSLMPGWKRPELEDIWVACDEGVEAALARARTLSAHADEVAGFEQLLGSVEGLLDPLEPFADAEDRFRRLRA